MPYKRKEDRTEAVRRYRERKKGLKAVGVKIIEDNETLGEFLRELGFYDMNFENWYEWSIGCKKDEIGIWHDGEGKIVYPPKQVFFGWNTMVLGDHIG